MSFIGNTFVDRAILYSGTVSSSGAGSRIDTTGYAATTWQVTGSTFNGVITAEGSADSVYWSPVLITNLSAVELKTQIETVGLYQVKSDVRWLRYNVQAITGTVSLTILGNSAVSTEPADRLNLAMDAANNTPLYVNLQNPPKSDAQGAAIPSDAPIAVTTPVIAVNGTYIVDSTGYQSITITTQGFVGTVAGSNDGISFNAILGYSLGTSLATSTLAANTNYVFPCLTRFIRLTATTAGQLVYYLRSQPFSNLNINLQQIGAAAVSQASSQLGINVVNIAGQAAGSVGSAAAGVMPIGATDPGSVSRRIISDGTGRLQIATQLNTVAPASISTTSNILGTIPLVTGSMQNTPALNSQDTSNFEGQTQIELLSQILLELKILNQQIHELPTIQTQAFNGASVAVPSQTAQLGDEPSWLRAEQSLFDKQQ